MHSAIKSALWRSPPRLRGAVMRADSPAVLQAGAPWTCAGHCVGQLAGALVCALPAGPGAPTAAGVVACAGHRAAALALSLGHCANPAPRWAFGPGVALLVAPRSDFWETSKYSEPVISFTCRSFDQVTDSHTCSSFIQICVEGLLCANGLPAPEGRNVNKRHGFGL